MLPGVPPIPNRAATRWLQLMGQVEPGTDPRDHLRQLEDLCALRRVGCAVATYC